MQYRETDWSFIKRLSAMNQMVIFADCSTKGEKYHFGIPERRGSICGKCIPGGGAGLRTQPERKFWRNKEGKEIELSPERILLANNDGTYIELYGFQDVELSEEKWNEITKDLFYARDNALPSLSFEEVFGNIL